MYGYLAWSGEQMVLIFPKGEITEGNHCVLMCSRLLIKPKLQSLSTTVRGTKTLHTVVEGWKWLDLMEVEYSYP